MKRYRNPYSWPAITMAEQKAAVRRLKAQGRREIDETMIFTTTLRQREIEDAAQSQPARLLAGGGNSDLHLRPPTRRAEASRDRFAQVQIWCGGGAGTCAQP